MNEIEFERETDTPDDWESNVIFRRNAFGTVEKIVIPDDEEDVSEDDRDT